MINDLIKLINKKKISNLVLSLLLVYIHDYKVKTIGELTQNILNEYLNQINKKGHLYCMYNKMYDDNEYKLGRAQNVKQRIRRYTTSYKKPSEIKYESNQMNHYTIAENILFCILKPYRVESNREFFNCDLDLIKRTIDNIENEIANIPIIKLINKYDLVNSKIYIFNSKLRQTITYFEKELNKNFIANSININFTIDFQTYMQNTIYGKIYRSNDLSKEKFSELSQGLPENLTIAQTYQLQKYIMKEMCGIAYFDIDFIKDNYKNMNMKLTNDYFFNDNTYILRKSEYWEQKKTTINNIINELGFSKPATETKLSAEIFKNNMNKIIANPELFRNISKSAKMFESNKNKLCNIKTIKQFMGFMNTLFVEYGIKLTTWGKSKKINKKVKKIGMYKLDYIDINYPYNDT